MGQCNACFYFVFFFLFCVLVVLIFPRKIDNKFGNDMTHFEFMYLGEVRMFCFVGSYAFDGLCVCGNRYNAFDRSI